MTTLFTSDHEWLRIEGDVAGRGADMPAHEISGGFGGGFQRRVHGFFP
jgi:hypothetical protein